VPTLQVQSPEFKPIPTKKKKKKKVSLLQNIAISTADVHYRETPLQVHKARIYKYAHSNITYHSKEVENG
jgi:hypothetical protein